MTHMPAPTITLRGGDKMAHFLAYGALGGLLYLALWTNNPGSPDLVFKILVIGMCYGALDEWTQALPWFNRTCDFVDWCADVAGLSVAKVLPLTESTHSPSMSILVCPILTGSFLAIRGWVATVMACLRVMLRLRCAAARWGGR